MSETSEETIVNMETLLNSESKLVLYNDDVNSFDHVIDCLVKYCSLNSGQAQEYANIIHENGKAVVKTGTYVELVPICKALLDNNLSAEIE
jgi:ATP-dependent Clp protease adaptor protein ClpS